MPFVHSNSLLVVTINGIGLVFEFVYLTIFIVYAKKAGRKKVGLYLLVEAILFAAIVLITMLALHGTTKRSLIVGILCDMFNIAMYVSPLTVMEFSHGVEFVLLLSCNAGALDNQVEHALVSLATISRHAGYMDYKEHIEAWKPIVNVVHAKGFQPNGHATHTKQ
ncbi:hypothetical protein P8452_12247 [Trifolium repens]|nr:hypothetical protein P8452_12247 [Trifolium repens]